MSGGGGEATKPPATATQSGKGGAQLTGTPAGKQGVGMTPTPTSGKAQPTSGPARRATRDSSLQANTTSTPIYLHSDHLGSVSVATSAAGAKLSEQVYDPWGKVRSGGVSQTKVNYTGQHSDDTGLLYYHARYYDPNLARFISPDSIVPQTENSSLTVDFHETEFAAAITTENAKILGPASGPMIGTRTGHRTHSNSIATATCSTTL